MRPEQLLTRTPQGLFCPPGRLHIDPTVPVDRALITHGHSDHARAGHGAVLATGETLKIMAARYGEDFAGTTQAVKLGETMTIGATRVTFHPAVWRAFSSPLSNGTTHRVMSLSPNMFFEDTSDASIKPGQYLVDLVPHLPEMDNPNRAYEITAAITDWALKNTIELDSLTIQHGATRNRQTTVLDKIISSLTEAELSSVVMNLKVVKKLNDTLA